jgi:uncharacterized membrane protein YkvA (DUF1232 family)
MKFLPDNVLVLLTCLAVLAVCILIFALVFKIALKIRSSKLKFVALGLSALYILSPLDLIPDTIPILGQLDDAGAFAALLSFAISIYRDFKKKKKQRQ